MIPQRYITPNYPPNFFTHFFTDFEIIILVCFVWLFCLFSLCAFVFVLLVCFYFACLLSYVNNYKFHKIPYLT